METSDELFLDRLFEAGCDDATVFFKDGYVCLDFTRESDCAESAVISAIKDFERSGIGGTVERVEPEDLASLSEIAHRGGVTRASLQKYARGVSKLGKDFPGPVQNAAPNSAPGGDWTSAPATSRANSPRTPPAWVSMATACPAFPTTTLPWACRLPLPGTRWFPARRPGNGGRFLQQPAGRRTGNR